jgi:ribosomal protein S18 acetylase RimI-like enzyme
MRLADTRRDNRALCALARACPQGETLRFYHARDDHWERCRLYAAARVVVAERGGAVVGAATASRKQAWVNGTWQPVAYLFDRMVHPDHRRRGIGRALLERQLADAADARLCYSLVLEENHANLRLFERVGFRVHPRRLLYLALLPALYRRRRPPGFRYHEPIDPRHGACLDRHLHPSYALADATGASGHGLFQLENAAGRAAAVLYRHGLKTVVRAPWYCRWLGRFLPWIPQLRRPLATWSLSHLWSDGATALEALLAGVAAYAHRRGVQVVLLPLDERDPRLDLVRQHTVQQWGIAATRVCVQVHGALAPALLQSPRPFLASGRDG